MILQQKRCTASDEHNKLFLGLFGRRLFRVSFFRGSSRSLLSLLGELFAFKFFLNDTNQGLEARFELGGLARFNEPIKSEVPRLANFPFEFLPPAVAQSMRHADDEAVLVFGPRLRKA